MIADADPVSASQQSRLGREPDEWLWEDATEFCAALDFYAAHSGRPRRKAARAHQIAGANCQAFCRRPKSPSKKTAAEMSLETTPLRGAIKIAPVINLDVVESYFLTGIERFQTTTR
jgi:hypothetical protein